MYVNIRLFFTSYFKSRWNLKCKILCFLILYIIPYIYWQCHLYCCLIKHTVSQIKYSENAKKNLAPPTCSCICSEPLVWTQRMYYVWEAWQYVEKWQSCTEPACTKLAGKKPEVFIWLICIPRKILPIPGFNINVNVTSTFLNLQFAVGPLHFDKTSQILRHIKCMYNTLNVVENVHINLQIKAKSNENTET